MSTFPPPPPSNFQKFLGSVRLMSRVLIQPINCTAGSTVLEHAQGRRFYSPYQNPLLYTRHGIWHNDHSLIPNCNLLLAAIHFYLICSGLQRLRLTVRRKAWISLYQHSSTSCGVWQGPCRLHDPRQATPATQVLWSQAAPTRGFLLYFFLNIQELSSELRLANLKGYPLVPYTRTTDFMYQYILNVE